MSSFLVLCLHSSPWSQPGIGDAGGMNVYVRHTCDELVKAGHDVTCVTLPRSGEVPLPGPMPRWLHVLDLPLAEVGKGSLPEHFDSITEAVAPFAKDADAVLAHYWISAEVGRRIAAERLTTMFHTTGAAKNASSGPGERPEPAHRIEAERRAAQASRAVLVNTPGEDQETARLLNVPLDRFQVAAPGIDHTVYHPGDTGKPSDADTRRDRDEIVVGLAGRLQPLKGPQILLEALRIDAESLTPGERPLRAWIIGDGPSDFMAELRASAPERVDFLGRLDSNGLADRMRDADLWAVPSSSETFGLVAAEAQACGTPVIATDVGGLPHAVGGGWLVPDRDPASWARTLRFAASSTDERARRAQAAVEHVRELTWPNTARRIAEVLLSARSHL